MLASVVLGLAVGAAAGALLASGTACFNAGVRRAVFDRRGTILRVFGLAVAAQMVLLPVLIALEVSVSRTPLLPVAQLVGGLLFGIGIALAGGCIAGVLWKSGAGSLATAIAIVGFAVGELLMRGPGVDVLRDLDAAGPQPAPADSTLFGVLGIEYAPIAIVLGIAGLAVLFRGSRRDLAIGLGLGVVGALAWVAAGIADYGYGLGFTGTAETVRVAIERGDPQLLNFEVWLALGVVLGALVAVRGPLRLPDGPRAARAAVGGVIMGVGANIAHGCNIGLGLTGVPLLSLGAILATVAMAAGVVLAWALLLRPVPALRGHERPEPDW